MRNLRLISSNPYTNLFLLPWVSQNNILFVSLKSNWKNKQADINTHRPGLAMSLEDHCAQYPGTVLLLLPLHLVLNNE